MCLFFACYSRVSALAVTPLKNGYSAVPAESAALLAAQPVQEQKRVAAQKPLIKKGQAEALTGLPPVISQSEMRNTKIDGALKATVTSKPATKAEAEVAALWAGEKELAYCGGEQMQLGQKQLLLFSSVSKTFFDKIGVLAGRKIHIKAAPINPAKTAKKDALKKQQNSQKTPAPKNSGSVHKAVAKASAAESGEKISSELNERGTPKNKKEQEIAADKNVEKKVLEAAEKTQEKKEPGEMHQKTKEASTEVVVAKKKPGPKQTAKKTNAAAAISTTKKKGVATEEAEQAETMAEKNRRAMPELKTPEDIAQVTDIQSEAQIVPANKVLNAGEIRAGDREGVDNGQGASMDAEPTKQSEPSAVDCEREGGKLARGRLAWIECFHRMAGSM